MDDKEKIIAQIIAAFAAVEYPGDWCLRGSNEGHEPYLLEEEFKGKTEWRALDPKFLDQAPDGYGSALSFFSDEAFRFYLPAYLIADIDGRLEQVNPVFYLIHGLDDHSRWVKINPQRYGEKVWFENACEQFGAFRREEAAAVIAYLTFKRVTDDFYCVRIDEAIKNYWQDKAA